MLNSWFDHVIRCISLPISAPACRPFWETAMYACAVIGVVLITWLAWKWFAKPVKQAPMAHAVAKPAPVVDKPVIHQQKRTEPEDIASDVTDPHLARKIRAELEQRRLKNLRG